MALPHSYYRNNQNYRSKGYLGGRQDFKIFSLLWNKHKGQTNDKTAATRDFIASYSKPRKEHWINTTEALYVFLLIIAVIFGLIIFL